MLALSSILLPMFRIMFVGPTLWKAFQVISSSLYNVSQFQRNIVINYTSNYTPNPAQDPHLGYTAVWPDAKFPPRCLMRKSRISRYPLSSSKASAAVLDPKDSAANEVGGEPTVSAGPGPDPGDTKGEPEPKRASTPGRPVELRFRIIVAPGLGGLPFTFATPKEPTAVKGLVWVGTGTWGEAEVNFPSARSENVPEGVLSSRRGGADLRNLTNAPTAAWGWAPTDPGSPTDSKVSAVLGLATGLPILSQNILQESECLEPNTLIPVLLSIVTIKVKPTMLLERSSPFPWEDEQANKIEFANNLLLYQNSCTKMGFWKLQSITCFDTHQPHHRRQQMGMQNPHHPYHHAGDHQPYSGP